MQIKSRLAWLSGAALAVVLVWAIAPAGAVEKVHFSDFEDAAKISADWSVATQGTTPRGKRKYFGPFASDTTRLSLKSLPKHQFVRVKFDLYLMQAWNLDRMRYDSADSGGPQYWGLRVEGGQTLLYTKFSNDFMLPRKSPQTYPCLLPGEKVPAGTGASSANTLGYSKDDSIYAMNFLFPHSADTIELNFFAHNLADERAAWGLDNVTVETLTESEVPALSGKALTTAWDDLGALDPQLGYKAAWQLVSQSDKAVSYAAERLGPAADESRSEHLGRRVAELVAQLDADKYHVRQRATIDLARMAGRAGPLIAKAHDTATSVEARWRLRQVLALLDDMDPAALDTDTRRRMRLAHVLELIHTAAAKKLGDRLGLMTP